MGDASLVLFIDLKPETKIGLRVVSKAAIAWADLVERTGQHFDPSHPVSIELEASEPGSQIVKAVIRSVTDDPKSIIKIAVVTSLLFVLKTSAAWTWEQVLEYLKGPDAPSAVRVISDEELTALSREIAITLNESLGESQRTRVYEELLVDENVTAVGMSSSADRKPQIMVPRQNFPPLVTIVEEEGFEKRSRVEEVELVLLKPVLTRENNKRWGFTWPYGRLGATIGDDDFLERMATGRLNVPMAQGIVFHVQLEITEERREHVWEVKSYNIDRVLSIRPPEQQDRMLLDEPE